MNLEEQLRLARRFAPKPAPALSQPPKARLELAALEDRLVPSSPATFYVTNGNSSGAGSLAAAAAAADANGNNDTIVILDATDGVTDITLDAPIINGASSNLSLDIKTEDGQQVSIHPDTLHQYAFRFINLTAPNGMALTLSDLNLSYFGSPRRNSTPAMAAPFTRCAR